MSSSIRSRLLPRLQDVFFISFFLAILLLGGRMLNLDGDFPRHLLTGKYILENHTVPTTELFIHPYLNRHSVSHASEWLSDFIFYSTYLLTGLAGVIALSATVLASTFTLLYHKLSTRLNLRIPILLIVAWGAAATSLNWALRPHLFSMLLLSIWLIWADGLRRGEKTSIWKFPMLMLLWSNMHGEFIAGILVLVAYAIGWAIDHVLHPEQTNLRIGKDLWLAVLLSAFISVINPGGIGPWVGILGFVNNPYLMSRMMEANAPSFQMPELRIFFGLLAFSIFLLAIKKEKLSAGQGLLLAGFSAMGLMAIRNIHLYGIVAPFMLAGTLVETTNISLISRIESTLQKVESQIKGIFWPAITVIGLSLFIITNSTAKAFYQFTPPMFPVQAVEWLEKNPQQGKMFNDLNWGGYLALHLWPGQLTFVDSMADVTGEVTMQYETVITLANGWQKIFDQHNIQWVIIESNSLLARELELNQHWNVMHKDSIAIILHK